MPLFMNYSLSWSLGHLLMALNFSLCHCISHGFDPAQKIREVCCLGNKHICRYKPAGICKYSRVNCLARAPTPPLSQNFPNSLYIFLQTISPYSYPPRWSFATPYLHSGPGVWNIPSQRFELRWERHLEWYTGIVSAHSYFTSVLNRDFCKTFSPIMLSISNILQWIIQPISLHI